MIGRIPAEVLAAVTAIVAAIVGALAVALATLPIGQLFGVPEGNLFATDDPGFDALDLALLGAAAGWLGGAVLAGALVARRRDRRILPVLGATAVLAVAAASTASVSSSAADWWFPTVFFAVPPMAMAMAVWLGR